MLRIERLAQASLADTPFPYLVGEGLLEACDQARLNADFPRLDKVGFFAAEELDYGPAFDELLQDLAAAASSRTVGDKLGIDLVDRPRMVVVRKWSAARDGRPHTDGPDKAATALLYLNPTWQGRPGALRYLEGPDLDGSGSPPVPAAYGVLTAFVRSDTSWHGHPPFTGERRVVQQFWLVDEAAAARKGRRHKRAGLLQRLFPKTAKRA